MFGEGNSTLVTTGQSAQWRDTPSQVGTPNAFLFVYGLMLRLAGLSCLRECGKADMIGDLPFGFRFSFLDIGYYTSCG